MDLKIKEPTGDQCENNEIVFETKDQIGVAVWYPQMGGYAGKCVVILDRIWQTDGRCSIGGCFECFVWHDGSFPFGDETEPGCSPAHLHHCDPEQFIRFGEKVKKMNDIGKVKLEKLGGLG